MVALEWRQHLVRGQAFDSPPPKAGLPSVVRPSSGRPHPLAMPTIALLHTSVRGAIRAHQRKHQTRRMVPVMKDHLRRRHRLE